MTTSLAFTIQPTIWQNATPEAQINDVIRKPFCPIARVVGKEVLADGRTCLFVEFLGCLDHKTEEWVLPSVEINEAPPATIIHVKNAIAETTVVAGNLECYADGVRRDSTIGKLRAEEERVIAATWKQGDQAWYKTGENKYNRAEIYRDQKGLTSKKVQIMHWWSNHPEGIGLMWVNISDLLTNEQYSKQKQAEAEKRVAAPAAVVSTPTDNEPPNRDDNGRGRVSPITKTVSTPAQSFFKIGDRIMHNDKGTATIIWVGKREIKVESNNNEFFLLGIKSFYKKGWEII